MSTGSGRRRRLGVSCLLVPGTPGLGITVPAVTAPSMHEQVKQRAGSQEQERQYAEGVRPVFGDQIKSGNREKCHESDVRSRPSAR